MRIDIDYISRKHYTKDNITQWMWYYRPFVFINGFQIRIFGVHIKVMESNATQKLIAMAKKRMGI